MRAKKHLLELKQDLAWILLETSAVDLMNEGSREIKFYNLTDKEIESISNSM